MKEEEIKEKEREKSRERNRREGRGGIGRVKRNAS